MLIAVVLFGRCGCSLCVVRWRRRLLLSIAVAVCCWLFAMCCCCVLLLMCAVVVLCRFPPFVFLFLVFFRGVLLNVRRWCVAVVCGLLCRRCRWLAWFVVVCGGLALLLLPCCCVAAMVVVCGCWHGSFGCC